MIKEELRADWQEIIEILTPLRAEQLSDVTGERLLEKACNEDLGNFANVLK